MLRQGRRVILQFTGNPELFGQGRIPQEELRVPDRRRFYFLAKGVAQICVRISKFQLFPFQIFASFQAAPKGIFSMPEAARSPKVTGWGATLVVADDNDQIHSA